MIGKKIDERYTISEEIGRGSMGHVYRALDEETRREVALKIVDLTQSPNPSDLQWRFRREAKTLLTLDHPNIVSCFAMGELGQENRFYLVMEYLKGQVLTEYLEQHEPLSVDTALDIVQQLARALAYIHQRGIVHRDIKPSNVIVSINGTFRAKLLDFGLAHLAGDDGPGEGALVGTFPYMSPEQTGVVRQALDGRSDLYSLGVTFYRMLTGQLPFQADSINALIHQHLARRPTPPHELREGLPDDVERMILRLLEKDVAARYQTAEGLAEDIERTKSGQQGFELSTDARQQAQVFNTIGLVGRDNELETIDRLLGRAAAGDGQVLFVSGSAGIGKSRLMDELRTRAASKRGTFLIGSCEETDRRIPFHPLKSAISDYLMQMRGETTKVSRLRSIGKRYGGVLCQIIPELKQILPEIGPALPANTPAQARKRLFLTALVDLFSQWGASGEPLVLLLEDLHWVDLGTLQFLEAAAAKLTSAHCLVALTAIDEASGHPRRLSRYLGIMRETKAPFTAFELAPFDLEAMQAFIIGKLGQPPERLKTVARLVLQRTQGIPYEASTYVETLVTEGVLWRDPGGWKLDEEKFDTLRYSTEVVNTIVRRLAMIDRAKYHLLSLASVIGNEVEFELLHHISGRSADELMDALEEGTRHRLIVQQGHQLLYKFSHQKIRTTLYSRLSERLVERTHRQIAAFLESHGDEQDGDLAYRLAHHYEAGGDKPKALEWLMRAGETALGEFSIREARGYFERAKLHVDSTTERDVARRLDERIGDINSVQGRPEEALVSYQNALADESAQGSVRRIKRKIGMLHQQTGDSRSAVRYLEESLRGWGIWLPKSRWTRIVSIIVQVLRWLYYGTLSKLGLQKSCASVPAHEQELVRIYETLSFATFYFDLIACYDYHLRHYNTLSRLGMKNRDVILCLMHAIASLDRGLFGRAMRFYKLAVGLMKRLQGVGDLARALKFQGAFLWSIGKLRNAVSTMRRALAAAEETGNSLDLNENLSILGNLYLDHGEFRSAIGAFERLNQSPYARDKVAALLGEAMASVYLGKLELAREKVGEAKAAADESPQPGIQVMLSYVAGHVTHKSGDWQGAWRELRQAYDLNQAEHIPRPLEIRGRIYILELLLDGISRKSKRRPWLLRQFRSMLRETRRMGRSFVCYHAWLLMLEGQFEEELGRRDSAVRLMRLALRSLRRAGMRFQYAEALVLFSRMIYADAGEPLGTALGLYQQMGLSREGQQIQRILSQRRRHSDDSSSWESSRDVQPHAYLTHRRELSSLLEINQALSAVLDYDELLTKIMDSVVQFAGAERGFLMTYGAEGSPLDVRVARNIDRRTIEGEAFRVSRNIINRVLETEKPVLISDAEADPDFNTAESVVRYNLRSILCIPLKHGKKILGVLYLENNLIRNLFTDADADLLSVLATQATISLQNARLFQMATTDSLTGAYLRRFMENRLKEEFERSERYGNPLSVLMVDVDHFKSVNDTYHHQVGDLVLQKIAGILKANVRDTDLVARYGGEEFCVLLPETTSERGLEVAQRLREAIASADVAPVPQVTASLGLATIPNDAISHPQKLIEAADKALYAAKESGRNRVCVASLEGPPESKSTTERTKPPPPPQAASQSKTLRSNK